jgi:hypothetical protein
LKIRQALRLALLVPAGLMASLLWAAPASAGGVGCPEGSGAYIMKNPDAVSTQVRFDAFSAEVTGRSLTWTMHPGFRAVQVFTDPDAAAAPMAGVTHRGSSYELRTQAQLTWVTICVTPDTSGLTPHAVHIKFVQTHPILRFLGFTSYPQFFISMAIAVVVMLIVIFWPQRTRLRRTNS